MGFFRFVFRYSCRQKDRAVKLRGQCTNPRTQGSRDLHTSMPLRKQKQPSTAASGMAQHLTGRSKANISTKRPPRNMLDSGYKYTVVAPSSSSVACQDSTQQGKLEGPTQSKPNWGGTNARQEVLCEKAQHLSAVKRKYHQAK